MGTTGIKPVPEVLPTHKDKDLSRYRVEKHPVRVLPYQTKSICPLCKLEDEVVTVIDATVYEEDGKVMMKKACDKHGEFVDVYWSDAEMFKRVMPYWYKSIGIDNPRTESIEGCPKDCGQCPNHRSHTALAIIDVTNRCNLSCPICFANAGDSGTVYEPTPEEVLKMMKNLRHNLPVPCPGIQFAGGEPTLSENLPQYVKWAKGLGFNHIMIATNGIRMAKSIDYVRELVEAGLNTIYLQFDGVTAEPYLAARNVDLRPIKQKVLNNCEEAGLDGVILVPTIMKGVNDNQVGQIIQFALENRDIVRCVNFQPVSITGRIDHEELRKMRITIPEVIHLIEEQTAGKIKVADWYTIPSMVLLGRALGLIKGSPELELSAHFACGMASFLFLRNDGSYYPITEVIDIDKILNVLGDICNLYAEGKQFASVRAKLKLAGSLRHIKKKGLIKDLTSMFLKRGSYSSLRNFMHNVIMLGLMHFMDPYNLDLERIQYCDINYPTPDGRIIPFCTYNNIYRQQIEDKFGKTQEEWCAEKRAAPQVNL
ncbi:MAG: tetraether lipid synthase Tes [Candidatus Freyarchaeum deiterrae]